MAEKETFKLIIPTMAYEKEIQAFRQEFIVHGGSMDGCLSLRKTENIADWLKQLEDFSSADTCPAGFVPQTQFIYLRTSDNKVVGVIQVRHYLNDLLARFYGHIGYSVCHSEREKGYGTAMLKAILPVCRELGLERILITCLKDNEGSRRVIQNSGGVYESTVYKADDGLSLERYWIELSQG